MSHLMRGSSGEEVEKLQRKLSQLGYYRGKQDGLFGSKVHEAVTQFQTNYFVDGIVDEKTGEAIDRAIDSWSKTKMPRSVPVPQGISAIEDQFGKILFDEGQAGQVTIKNDFVQRVKLHDFPIVGRQYFHEGLISVLEGTLIMVEARGLDKEFCQFGTWSPRHKMHNPKLGLSTHSWAIAFDLNWATNPVGSKGNLSKELVATITSFGWNWGGSWTTPDPMHFQYCTGY